MMFASLTYATKSPFCLQFLFLSFLKFKLSSQIGWDICCTLSEVSIFSNILSAQPICINLNLSKMIFFAEVLLKTVLETSELKAWSKYQVHFQKVTDIRWARLRGPGPYYRHWPVKYSIDDEHAQQNGIIWEDVTPYTKVTHPGRAEAESPTREW